MTGRYNGFNTHLEKAAPGVFCIHCVIHRQHLVAKKISAHLHDALTAVIKVGNHINKIISGTAFFMNYVNRMEKSSAPCNTYRGKMAIEGNCLQCFIVPCYSIVSFFANKQLGEQLLATKYDVFHLSDIFE